MLTAEKRAAWISTELSWLCCRLGDTGQGALTIGQGVYRSEAVLVAGAETLVTSLWRIDDQATGELMLSYYQKLLDKVQPRIGWGHAGGDAVIFVVVQGVLILRTGPRFQVIGMAGPLRSTPMR